MLKPCLYVEEKKLNVFDIFNDYLTTIIVMFHRKCQINMYNGS